jgi:hypothetical protein
MNSSKTSRQSPLVLFGLLVRVIKLFRVSQSGMFFLTQSSQRPQRRRSFAADALRQRTLFRRAVEAHCDSDKFRMIVNCGWAVYCGATKALRNHDRV